MNSNESKKLGMGSAFLCCTFLIAFNCFLVGGVAYIAAPKISDKLTTIVVEVCEAGAKAEILGTTVSFRTECRKSIYEAQGYKDMHALIDQIGNVGLLTALVAGLLSCVFGYLALRRKYKAVPAGGVD